MFGRNLTQKFRFLVTRGQRLRLRDQQPSVSHRSWPGESFGILESLPQILKDLCPFLNTKILAFLKIHSFLTVRVRGLKLGRSIDIMGDFGYTKFKGPGPLPWAPTS